jgi:peptide/nickel transport system ATP-binding protein
LTPASPKAEPAAERVRQPLLNVQNLRVESRIGRAVATILDGVNLELHAGETLGIVGESGSGKSMTARAITGLLPNGVDAHGSVLYAGDDLLRAPERRLRRIRGTEIGMVLQDPFTMLNPLLRVGRHITEMLRDERGKRLNKTEQHAEARDRLAEVGIHDARVADRYPFELSGGMRQRVAIAAALARDPKVLIADEPSTALDVTTQKEILALLHKVQEERQMGLILITHDLRVAFSVCDRISVLYAGSLLESSRAALLEKDPLHPYTLGLLLSEPPVERRLSELTAIPGSVPTPDAVADRCPFAPRCRWRMPRCEEQQPPLRPFPQRRESACIRVEEILDEMRAVRSMARAEVTNDIEFDEQPAVVEARNLRKVFGKRGEQTVALDDVRITVRLGEAVGIVGESGSGKTTLGRCLVGLETLNSGQILIDAVDTSNYGALSAVERATARQTIQMIFQDPYSTLNPVRSIGATLREAVAMSIPKPADTRAAVAELLELVGLPQSYARRKPIALSGGERQRVAIARALAVKPKVIVCDEPVSALDVSVQSQILQLFRSLREDLGLSYIFITHDLAVLRQIADRAYVMYRGEVVDAGPVDRLLDAPTVPYTAQLLDSVPRADAGWLKETQAAAPHADGVRST